MTGFSRQFLIDVILDSFQLCFCGPCFYTPHIKKKDLKTKTFMAKQRELFLYKMLVA